MPDPSVPDPSVPDPSVPDPSVPDQNTPRPLEFKYRFDMNFVPQEMFSEHPPNSIPEREIRDRIVWISKALAKTCRFVRTEFEMEPSELLEMREQLAKEQCIGEETPYPRSWVVYRLDARPGEPQKPQSTHIGVITPVFARASHRLKRRTRSQRKSCNIYNGIEAIHAAAKKGRFPLSANYAITSAIFVQNSHPMLEQLHPILTCAASLMQVRPPMMMDPSSALVQVPSTNDRRPVVPEYSDPTDLGKQWFHLLLDVYKVACRSPKQHEEILEGLAGSLAESIGS